MFWTAVVASSALLVAGVRAGGADMLAMRQGYKLVARAMGDDTASRMAPEKRQSTGINLDTGNSSLDLTQWNSDTTAACGTALALLSAASNPSGTAVCYNVASLETSSGVFMADLRLFQVSTPFAEFMGIASENIQVGLQYHGATVSAVQQQNNSAAQQQNNSRRDVGDLSGRSLNPTPLQTYMFVGQIDKEQMAQPMTMGALEALLLPIVTLKAVNSGGQTVSTNVSSNEAAFVNGIFSQETVMSDLALAQVAVNNVTAQLANGTIAFVLPGVNILIFPVGLVVTGVWTVLGLAVYGYGTFERINYRASYRSRKSRDAKPGYNSRI